MNIIAVVVLYQCRPDQSSTIVSLVRSWERNPAPRPELKLVIYDNGPQPQPVTIQLPFQHQYVHDAANGGLVRAYNSALQAGSEAGCRWLVLLDQDSELPVDFIEITAQAIAVVDSDETIAAIVPTVRHGSLPISPARLQWTGRIIPLHSPTAGILSGPFTAINSGTVVRIPFMMGINGFDQRFPLDYLDHWLFATINRLGRSLYVTDARIAHDLSIYHHSSQVNTARYRGILRAETLFARTCLPRRALPMRMAALAVRAVRLLLWGQTGLARITAGHVCSMLMGTGI